MGYEAEVRRYLDKEREVLSALDEREIITKERTEGGLNKRASLCALLFSTLLVFPN